MDKLIFGLGVMVLGMLVVFTGLVILIGFIKLLTLITARTSGAKKKEAAADPTSEPVNTPAAAPALPEGVSAEVIAAITAAIASVWEGETGFVVRHVKRITNAPVWNRAGREEQTYSHF